MTKKEIQGKFDEIVDFSGCELYIDTPTKRYSSGMTVRLGFAVAAFLDPEILVVDEVLAVGDAEFQNKAIGKMKEVSHNSGRTVLFVSHNMGSIKQLCSRALTMVNGQIGFQGNVTESINMYLSDGLKVSETGIIPLEMKRSIGTSMFKFTKVELLKLNGIQSKDFYFGEPILARLNFSVFKEVSDYSLMVKIGTQDGQRIILNELNSDSLLDETIPRNLTEGNFRCEVNFSSILQPGFYSIYLGFGEINGKTLDWVERVYDFNVHKAGIIENYRWSTSLGYVCEKNNWKITKL
jgi:lipopolysaccharide transport system ATP-binding protein